MQRLTVKPETALVRPFVTAAVLRGVTFDAARYASFIDLQVLLPSFPFGERVHMVFGPASNSRGAAFARPGSDDALPCLIACV